MAYILVYTAVLANRCKYWIGNNCFHWVFRRVSNPPLMSHCRRPTVWVSCESISSTRDGHQTLARRITGIIDGLANFSVGNYYMLILSSAAMALTLKIRAFLYSALSNFRSSDDHFLTHGFAFVGKNTRKNTVEFIRPF